MELDFEDSGFALQVLRMVFLGEGHIDVELVAGAVAHNLILEAGDELAGAKGQGEFLRFAAVESNAVYEALEVDDNSVAVGSSPVLHGDGPGVAVAHPVDLSVDVLVGDSLHFFGSLDAFVIFHGHFGLHGADSLEGHAVFLGNVRNVHFGRADDLQAGLGDGFLDGGGVNVVDSFFIEKAFAVELLNGFAGSFALAEAGDLDLFDPS